MKKQSEKSSANLGQPSKSICDSWYITNSIFLKLLKFVNKNQNFDFNYHEELTWQKLERFSDEEILNNVSGKGISKKNIDNLKYCLGKLRNWNLKKGERVPFSEKKTNRIKEIMQSDSEYITNMKETIENREIHLQLKEKHKLDLLKILESSNNPVSDEILEYMKDDLKVEGALIEYVEPISWTSSDGGYSIAVNSTTHPLIPVIERKDAIVNGYKLTCVRSSPLISGSYTVYVDLDTDGVIFVQPFSDIRTLDKFVWDTLRAKNMSDLLKGKLLK